MSAKNNYSLSALGIVTPAGTGIDEHASVLFAPDRHYFSTSAEYYSSRAMLVGSVASTRCTKLGDRYNSQALHLLSMAFTEIEPAVHERIETHGAERIAIVLGTSTAGMHQAEDDFALSTATGVLPDSFRYGNQEIGSVADILALLSGARGPRYVISTACSSGANTFISGARLLDNDLADVVLVGGVDALARLNVRGFDSLGILSKESCNAFSKNRTGTVLGEGAALFLMEKGDRGVRFAGGAASSDAHHLSSPDPQAAGALKAICDTLRNIQRPATDVSYVNLHGTATPANDIMEATALTQAGLENTACSSSKPLIGHTLGAAGAIEAGFCWIALQEFLVSGKLRLPVHLFDGEYDPDIPVVSLVSTPAALSCAEPLILSNSFGFGGANTCLAFEALR